MSDQPRDLKPNFIVQRQEGPFTKKVLRFVKKDIGGGKIINEKVIEEKVFTHGYMVAFPKGHTVFVETDAELARLGFDSTPNIIDMDTGDVVSSLGIPGFSLPTKSRATVVAKDVKAAPQKAAS
jgi:hypothetical protein